MSILDDVVAMKTLDPANVLGSQAYLQTNVTA